MDIFKLEHDKVAYRADIALYCITIAALAVYLMSHTPRGVRLQMAALALAGLASWTAIEYAMHRFLLHGLQPFRSWHDRHHQRPKAIIFTPTILSLAWQFALIFIPALFALGLSRACALTAGMLTGYLAYTITHHAVHHGHSDNPWLKRRKRWHAIHHHHTDKPACYGVTTEFWDRVFGSTPAAEAAGKVKNKPDVY